MNLEINGNAIITDLIGGFKINNNEYAVCFYIDSDKNSKLIITEIIRNGDQINTKEIPKEDMELVLAKYKEIETQLLGGDINE